MQPIEFTIGDDLTLNFDQFTLNNVQAYEEFLYRYLKMRYNSVDQFVSRFIQPFVKAALEVDRNVDNYLERMIRLFVNAIPYSWNECWTIQNDFLRGIAFSAIDIAKIIEECNGVRIKTEGIEQPQRIYKEDGTYEVTSIHLVYEMWKADLSKINQNLDKGYAIKCWCTSTSEEHFLWIPPESADMSPLEAIASLCYVWDGVLSKNPTLKRHGDVFLFETDEVPDITGNPLPLTKDEYFSILVAQS